MNFKRKFFMDFSFAKKKKETQQTFNKLNKTVSRTYESVVINGSSLA